MGMGFWGVRFCLIGVALPLTASLALADKIPVTTDNFVRAESDRFMGGIVNNGAFGKWDHTREPSPMDKQTVIRLNRDTLYSAQVLDLDAGPVTITLPDTDGRFISLQIISEDHYTPHVYYEPGDHTITREDVGTRYALAGVRILVNPDNADDVGAVHALQDKLAVKQDASGTFEVPDWDEASQAKVRASLLTLSGMLPDTRGMFGAKGAVDPVRHLLGAAHAWGGNPEKDALYLNVVPEKNDGDTVYSMTVGDVPVDGFWSVTVYDADGYFEPNASNAYSLNNITAKKGDDGKVTIQFGGCTDETVNCLPTPKGWNYMVRLYRPSASVLDGSWKFPVAEERHS
ncbi:DUF1254 domain-containing protein [Hyphomicrobium sp. D-2]|uniref:DUF1254 domain-containing protein n=1 Tax=Hyphomicrobium sp. D-2 TaxID=3041621 RepID=UPI002453978B|nr:DUF1254 domain-containing protein [Hyphomicrobium sp. D-2]MDH4981060.1 DUF1254 domain-containing protein [Hyphomicrobium sp. D-2]